MRPALEDAQGHNMRYMINGERKTIKEPPSIAQSPRNLVTQLREAVSDNNPSSRVVEPVCYWPLEPQAILEAGK